ncbi:MAG: hypothetical protein IJ733_04115 [Lachnospiraceae bacterium]|nr:hypothetical protein [Lachnospiraceae bacterium]
MILYLEAETDIPDLVIDFIEVRLSSGKVVSLNWDESGIEPMAGNAYYAVYEGVYFDEEYANGRVGELIGMQVVHVETYSDSGQTGSICIKKMLFEDGGRMLAFEEPFWQKEAE